jgi:hypothetical protein
MIFDLMKEKAPDSWTEQFVNELSGEQSFAMENKDKPQLPLLKDMPLTSYVHSMLDVPDVVKEIGPGESLSDWVKQQLSFADLETRDENEKKMAEIRRLTDRLLFLIDDHIASNEFASFETLMSEYVERASKILRGVEDKSTYRFFSGGYKERLPQADDLWFYPDWH